MKKRVLSALLVLCMACSMVSTVWAANEQATPETADKPQSAPVEVTIATPESAAPAEDPAPAQTPAETVAYTAVAEQEGQPVNVIVDVPVGAFDETVTPVLHADAVSQEQADQAAETVADQTGAAFDGMMVLDVYFTDGDNTEEIEPALPVSVRFELPEAALPEDVDASSLTVHHLAEEKDEAGNTVTDENGEAVVNVETVATATTTDDVAGVIALSTTAAEKTAAGEEVARIEDLPELQAEVAADNAEEPGVVAAFEVDGFSTFTITWSIGDGDNQTYYDTLTVERINQQGTGVGDDFVVTGSGAGTLSVETIAEDHQVEGYTFTCAVIAESPTQALERIDDDSYCVQEMRNSGKNWQYNIGHGNWKNIGKDTIYFIYKVNGVLTIDDSQLLSDGLLTPYYNNATEGNTLVYKWEKQAEDTDEWVPVTRQAVTEVNGSNLYNVAEDGSWVNVALDDGARCTYRVRLVSINGEELSSSITSVEYKVPYYDALQNGDFESPHFKDGEEHFVGSGTEKVVWKTTGENTEYGSRVELVGTSTYMWHGVNYCPPAAGDTDEKGSDQCAELNADSSGALYQDVLTTPGSTMYGSLMHNGRTRNGNKFNASDHVGYGKSEQNPAVDSMYVVIMSTDYAEKKNIETQAQVEDIIAHPTEYPGAKVVEIEYRWYWTQEHYNEDRHFVLHVYNNTTGQWEKHEPDTTATGLDGAKYEAVTTVWNSHAGEYVVPDGQYLTRYFFVAGKTELGGDENNTVGNHIDNVSFSTTVPTPADGTATLTIQKTIEGLTNTEYETLKDQLRFTVQIGNDEPFALYAESSDSGNAHMTWTGTVDEQTGTGTWTGTYVIQNIPIPANNSVNYTVTEVADTADVEGYQLTQNPTNGTVNGTLKDRDTGVVAFTNSYTATQVNLTLTKTFDGLSDAEVQYLMFERSGQKDNQADANFGFDINYCQTTLRDGKDGKTFLVDDDALGDLELPDGTKLTSTNLGGGAFYILAGKYLNNMQLSTYPTISDDPEYVKGYTDSATGASLKKNREGNWVYSITLTVPKTDSNHFFTIFEQHQEMPGYAKINDSNAEYTITGPGYDQNNNSGTGKFMDIGCTTNNIYEDMVEICGTGDNSRVYNGVEYNEEEDVCIAAGAFQRIQITGDTTIAFTNHYTGNLDVTKTISSGNQYDEAETKTYTLTIAPAHLSKLDLNAGTDGTQHGLNYKTVSYTIETPVAGGPSTSESGTATLGEKGSFTVSIKPGQIIHFTDMPAIQWRVTEDETGAAFDGYTLDVDYTDRNNGVVNTWSHWNQYTESDTIGGTNATDVNNETGDGIASVDSAVCDNIEHGVDASAVALVTVSNVYTRNTVTLTVQKFVRGNMSKDSDVFTFTLSLTKDNAPYTAALPYTQFDNSEAEGDQISTGTKENEDDVYTFTLSARDRITFTVPAGCGYTLTEIGRGDYTDTYIAENMVAEGQENGTNVTKGVTIRGTLTADTTQSFTNVYVMQGPVTGLERHDTPYVLMITAAGIAGLALIGAVVNRRIRRRRED